MLHYYSSPEDSNRISFAGEYEGNILKIAAARKSDKDVFIRKVGRKKAEGRLRGDILVACSTVSDASTNTFVSKCRELEEVIHSNPGIVNDRS